MSENLLNNNALTSLVKQAAPRVLHAIKDASVKTGVNFAYLVEQAAAESSFNEKAESRTSSAAGLYQFIESTWLGMVKKHGHKYGLGELSSKINDQNKVTDPQIKKEILALRKDPEKAALLAAEFAAENKQYLQRRVGGDIGSTELYFAHFMGAGGAAGFLNAMKENPLQTAADLFPRAARANRNVFYDRKTGEARTLAGVYEFFDKKFSAGAGDIDLPALQDTKKNNVKTNNYANFRGNTVDTNMMRLQAGNRDFMNAQMMQLLGTNTKQDSSDAWHPMPTLPRASLVFSPVDVMMMAQLGLTADKATTQR